MAYEKSHHKNAISLLEIAQGDLENNKFDTCYQILGVIGGRNHKVFVTSNIKKQLWCYLNKVKGVNKFQKMGTWKLLQSIVTETVLSQRFTYLCCLKE